MLVNNAGVLIDKPFLSMDEADWDTVIDTNLKGTFNATRACIFSFLKRKKGNIINMSSVAGFKGVEGQTNYSSSKAGVIGFTRSLARETGPYGVRVNSITPGFIETDMMSDMDEKIKDKCLSQTPLRRFGSPQDVADLVVFLARENAGFNTRPKFSI